MGPKPSKATVVKVTNLSEERDKLKAAIAKRNAQIKKRFEEIDTMTRNSLALAVIKQAEERIIRSECTLARTALYHLDCLSYPPLPPEIKSKLLYVTALADECISDQCAKKLMKEAKELMRNKKFEDAKKKLDEALIKASYRNTTKLIEFERDKAYKLADRSKKESNVDYLRDAIRNRFNTALDYRTRGEFQKALYIYDGLIKLLNQYNSPTLINEVMRTKTICLNDFVIHLRDKGDELVKQGKFETANEYLTYASKIATNPLITGDYYINIVNTSKKSCANAQAKFFQTEAHRLANEKNLEQAIKKIDEALKLANEHSTIQSLELDKFKYSKRDNDIKEAKRLQKLGNNKVTTNEFNEAIRAFEDALDYAHEESLIQSISTDRINAINKHAKFMQDEANKLVTQNKYEEAYVQFKNALEKARDMTLYESIKKDETNALNKQIKFLQELANKLATENNFDEAHENFEKALKVPGDIALIKSVKEDKAKVYNIQGLLCLKQAFDLDSKEPYTEQQAKEAREKFKFAKDRFQNADETNHTKEFAQNTQITVYKIYGDYYFNEALSLEDNAYAIYQEAKKTRDEEKYISARKKYLEALTAFTEAKWSYEEGLSLNRKEFKDFIKVVSEQIPIISNIAKGMDTVRMWCAFQNNEHLYAEMPKNASTS